MTNNSEDSNESSQKVRHEKLGSKIEDTDITKSRPRIDDVNSKKSK